MFLNGVWFAPLAAVSAQPDALASVLAAALPMSTAGAAPLARQVLDFVRDRELLLVLDNLEHLLDETGWLGELLTQAPHVKLLVTSRERLDLQAERVFALDGLPTPSPSVADAEAFAAVQLFLRRARRVQPDFQPQPVELAAIARICCAVQGLPLGIELAAAWAGQLTCAEIAGQIEQGLDFLATTRRDVAPRQRSLRAVFDWSWGRLAADEQAVFQQLAVFQGSFTRQAAQEVAGASLPVLTALVDKSLVWRRAVTYQLHEVARHFAGEKLRLAGREEDTQARHTRYYAELMARSKARLEGHEQKIVLEELDQEMENVRAAWRRLIAQRNAAGIAAATDGLYHILAIRSRFREGVEAFDAARLALQPLAATDPAVRLTYAKATARAGRFLSFLSRFAEARTLLQESLAVFRDLDERVEMAFALNHLGGTARQEGDLALAERYLEECLDLRRATGNQPGQAVALLELAGVAFMRADYERARDRCQEGLAVAETSGDLQTIAHLLTGLSLSYRELGQLPQALDYGRRSQAIYQELDDQYGQMQAALTLGELSRQMGQLAEAHQFCQQAVQLAQEIGDRSGEADGHYRLGQIAAGLEQRDDALEQLRLALELGREIQDLPITLDALLEIGCLLVKPDGARAAAILRFLLAHPQLSERNRPRTASALAALSAGTAETGSAIRSLAEIVTLASAP
ncbi:MAG: tetratricopeptide repeat protein [Anaerolineae bacterium]